MLLFESVAEHAFAGKAGIEADFLDGQRRVFQQVPGGSHPAVDDVFMGRIAGFLLENVVKMVFAHARGGGDPFDGQIFRKVLRNIGHGFFRRLGAVSGLAGVGDLIVTCTSVHSRNHAVGERLGRGERIADILASMQMVAEGVWNSKVVHEIAARLGVDMPICEIVYRACYEGYDAKDAVADMMGRGLKSE